MKIDIGHLEKITGGCLSTREYENDIIENIITDSREIKDDGDYSHTAFLGIVGETFDGNDFAAAALEKGVKLVITNRKMTGNTVLTVDDTLKAYGKIAGYHKGTLKLTTIGITGSVGKTTTKEVVYGVVSAAMKTEKTKASFNNEIGVPRMLLSLGEDLDAAVVEMGMRGIGQIEYLANFVRPDVGIITNIGCAHLELLGTKDNTLRAKLEIAKFCSTLILNGDDEYLGDKKKVSKILAEYNVSPKIVYYGLSENCDVVGKIDEMDVNHSVFTVKTQNNEYKIDFKAPGVHLVMAALAAITAGETIGIEPGLIKNALENFEHESTGRQKIARFGDVTVIDDCYNASPESMKMAISLLSEIKGAARRVAFLGDMLELGDVSHEEHAGVGAFAAKKGVDLVVTVGDRAKEIGLTASKKERGTCVIALDDSDAAASEVEGLLSAGDAVLVKGSHAMQMDKIVREIERVFTKEG